jgi:hypothetical protein
MLGQATTLLLAAGGPPAPPRHEVVRTELVHGSGGGFDWLDAAAGFGFAVVSAVVVLLVIGVVRGRRSRARAARSVVNVSPHRPSIGSNPGRANLENRKDVQP